MVKERTNQVCALGSKAVNSPKFFSTNLLVVVITISGYTRKVSNVVYATLNEREGRHNSGKGQNTIELNQAQKVQNKGQVDDICYTSSFVSLYMLRNEMQRAVLSIKLHTINYFEKCPLS